MKILYAIYLFPHGTQGYIETEIRAALALGADVHVWSKSTASKFPHPTTAPVHTGQSLSSCIAEVRPDLVHAYNLDFGADLLEEVRAAGVAFTIRTHGFEYSIDLLNRLAADRAVNRVIVFPHMEGDADPRWRRKIAALPTMYNPNLYPPAPGGDPRLVVRFSSALRTKNIEYFMRTALLCPKHRFVLVLGEGFDFNFAAAAHLKSVNAELGNPVEIRENLDWPAASQLTREAGIYMYTPPTHRPGMPISVAEAMASGCFVIAPDIEGMRAYLGRSGGRLYSSVEEAAAIIRSTESWSAADWREAAARAATHAARHHASNVLAPKLVAIWRRAIEAAHPRAPGVLRRLARRVAGAASVRP